MAAHQAPSSLGFSKQEHWSGLPLPSPMHESEKWKWSRSVVSDSLWHRGLQPTRLLCPWDFPGKSTGVGCHRLGKPEFLTGKRQQRIYKTWWPLGGTFYFLIREMALNSVFIILSSPSNRWGEGDGTPLQDSRLENPMNAGAWWAAVHGVSQSRTRLKWLSSSSSNRWQALKLVTVTKIAQILFLSL